MQTNSRGNLNFNNANYVGSRVMKVEPCFSILIYQLRKMFNY